MNGSWFTLSLKYEGDRAGLLYPPPDGRNSPEAGPQVYCFDLQQGTSLTPASSHGRR